MKQNSTRSKAIKLVYWNEPNFGDMLSPYVIGRLSGREIRYRSFYFGLGSLRLVAKYLMQFKFGSISNTLLFYEKNILGIGSIMGRGNRHSTAWGCGFLKSIDTFKGGEVRAVRGKHTNAMLRSQGYKEAEVMGDPALLLPLLVKPSAKMHEIAIIPHWSETDLIARRFGDRYKIIDLRTKDVERTIAEITSCKHILSTSLHGIIVPHAYGIPALWIKLNTLENDDLKFHDYFSSVSIEEYDGFKDLDGILKSEATWRNLFSKNADKALPNTDISTIQRELLRVAPFDVVKDYHTYDGQ